MPVASKQLGLLQKTLLNKELDFDTDAIKAMLCTSTYAPNYDTHQYKTSVTNEVVGTGYTATGNTLTSCTVTYTAANSWATARANSTAYTVGQVVRPATGNGFLYQCTTAGTSGASIPTYPTVVGQTVTDGAAVWTCVGTGITVITGTIPAWTTSTITARFCVIYDSTPATDTVRPLICIIDFGADVATTAGTFTVTPDAVLGLAYWFNS